MCLLMRVLITSLELKEPLLPRWGMHAYRAPAKTGSEGARCDKVFKEKRSGIDAGFSLKRCLDYLRDGDTLLVTKLDRLARSTSDTTALFRTLPTRVFN